MILTTFSACIELGSGLVFNHACAKIQEHQGSIKPKKLNSKEGRDLMKAFDRADCASPERAGSVIAASTASVGATPKTQQADDESNAGAEEGHPNSSKKGRQRDVVRFRANVYEKHSKLVQTCMTDHDAALQASDKIVAENAGHQESLKHFFDILKVRTDLLRHLAKHTQEEYDRFVSEQTQSDLSFQPVPEAQLKTTLVVSGVDGLVQKILAADTSDAIENAKTSVRNMLALHSQVRSAVKSSTKDIDNAIKSKAKRIEAAAKKQAQASQREKAKQAKAVENAAKAAAASTLAAGTQPSLLSVDARKFTKVQSFANFGEFEQSGNATADTPFLIEKFDPLQLFLADNVPMKCQLVNFGNQFLGTQICKQTGRAQCPVMGDDAQKHVSSLLCKAVNGLVVSLPDTGADDEAKVLKPVLHAALFGCSPDMEYAGVEDKALGQLRYVHSGTRKICMIKPADFLDNVMAKAPANIGDLIQAWKYVGVEELDDKKAADKVMCALQSAGSLLYVPPAWLVAEKVENGNPVIGLRQSVLAKGGSVTDEVDAMMKLMADGRPIKAIAKAHLSLVLRVLTST